MAPCEETGVGGGGEGEGAAGGSLTLLPLFMSAPNQMGLLALGLDLDHQDFLGTLAGLAEMQVSPLSMSQKTLTASLELPWLGSIQ